MAAEDRNGNVSTDEECTDCTTQERSFDRLTKGLASANVSRRGALRLLAGALFGGALASVPGVGRTAQAVTAPGGSTCNESGQSCTNQHCCEGYTCLTDATSGTDKFCCPDLLVCGSRCCPQNASCATGQRCECPSILPDVCPGGPTPQVGQCVNSQTDPDNCGASCERCEEPTGPNAPCLVRACVGGVCTTVPNLEADGDPCEEGNKCTLNDTCQAGVCTPGPLKNCNDNNECTADGCDPATGQCIHEPLTGRPCETGNRCTADICQSGTCEQGPVDVFCEQPANECQVAVCDPRTGGCVTQNLSGTPCNDGNLCTTGETCLNGTCQGGTTTPGCCRSASDCPTPANQCQQATCTDNVCGVENRTGTCDDGNPCTTNDTCQNGACTGTPRANCCTTDAQCNDNNPCTTDTCNQLTNTCVNTPRANCCTTDAQCNDNNPCTTDTCNQLTNTCVNTPRAGCCTTNAQCTGTGQICCATGMHANTCKGQTGASCGGNGNCCSNRCSRDGVCA